MPTIQKGQNLYKAITNKNELELKTLIKAQPKSHKGHKFILCIIDEVMNYLITVPIYHSRSEEIGDAIIENVILK